MRLKQVKKLWIIGTFLILMFFQSLGGNQQNNGIAGLIDLIIIGTSIYGYFDYKNRVMSKNYSYYNKNYKKVRKPRNVYTIKIDKEEQANDSEPLVKNESLTRKYNESDSEYKGRLGEDKILDEIERLDHKVEVIKNLIIKKQEGTTELDIIMLSSVGIYVFEVKNYSGWIFGSEKQKKWTQSFYTGKKESFMNPIHQNYGHIESLKWLLSEKYPHLNYYSVIVFTDKADLKKVPESTDKLIIENESNIYEHLNASISHAKIMKHRNLFTDDDVEEIFCYLLDYKALNLVERQDHVDYIKSIHNK